MYNVSKKNKILLGSLGTLSVGLLTAWNSWAQPWTTKFFQGVSTVFAALLILGALIGIVVAFFVHEERQYGK